MKKTASILLLAILTFNWVGYRFVSGFLEQKADIAFESRIDNSQYDESFLMELRVPMNTPYLATNSAEFERYNGEIEVDGIHYKYVKRKIENGELVLLCLPDETKTRFQNSRVDFFKLVNDLNHTNSTSKEKSGSSTFKVFTTEYQQENNSWTIKHLSQLHLQHVACNNCEMATGFTTTFKQPPRVNC